MKKISILSSLGMLTITTLPIVAVASCSSTTGADSNLTTEVGKFEKSFQVKDTSKDTTIEAANNLITNAQGSQAKLEALGTLIELPTMSSDFTYEVKSTSIDATTSSLKVIISITQKSNNESKDSTLTIVGFKTTTTSKLDEEAAKFEKSFALNSASKDTTITQANSSINSASEGKPKWDALSALVELPTIDEESFKYEVKSTTVDTATPSLKVSITITQISDSKFKDITLTVTGFKPEVSEALDKEVEKFTKSLSLKTTAVDTTLADANDSINNAQGDAKWTALETLVALPIKNDELFKYDVKSTIADTAKSELKVVITITQKSDSKAKDATLTITGFKPVAASKLDEEAAKFEKSFSLNTASAEVEITTANSSITNAEGSDAKWNALAALVELPPKVSEFTYVIKSNSIDNTNSTLKVVITITQTSDGSHKDANLVVTGFKPVTGPTLDDVAALFNVSVAARENNTPISTVVTNINRENNQTNKLETLSSFVTKFPDTPTGFELIIGQATIATETSASIEITVKKSSDNTTKVATFTITGLTARRPIEKELEKFLVPLTAANSETLITTAVSSINSANTPADKLTVLSNLVNKLPQVSEAFDLIIGSATPDAQTPTTMNVSFTIKDKADANNTLVETITVTGFKAETAEQELERLAAEALKDKPVLSTKASETAAIAAPKIIDNTTLDTYYTRVEVAENVEYAWKSATATGDNVQVVVTVTNTLKRASIDHTFLITGFTSELQAEANKFNISLTSIAASTTTRLAARNINDVDVQSQKLAAINKLVNNFPTIDESLYTLSIGEATVALNTATTITIQITVSKKVVAGSVKTEATSATTTFTITSLVAETAEAELTRIATEKLPIKSAARGQGLVTTTQAAYNEITTQAKLNMYYPRVTLGKDIIYSYGGVRSIDQTHNTVLNVTVAVINTSTSSSANIEYTIKIHFPTNSLISNLSR